MSVYPSAHKYTHAHTRTGILAIGSKKTKIKTSMGAQLSVGKKINWENERLRPVNNKVTRR